MSDVPFPSILSKLDAVHDSLTVKRVFGDPYEVGGVGFGINARPLGVVVITDGVATWTPTVDVNRIVTGGQLVGLAAVLVIGGILRRRARHRH